MHATCAQREKERTAETECLNQNSLLASDLQQPVGLQPLVGRLSEGETAMTLTCNGTRQFDKLRLSRRSAWRCALSLRGRRASQAARSAIIILFARLVRLALPVRRVQVGGRQKEARDVSFSAEQSLSVRLFAVVCSVCGQNRPNRSATSC